ncbi:methyl-accepting chemotaxis protein [Crassaminicella profunda]|uniref:methyl-accepting chemotaxis protein n=1 Tax=Crassaminicella profunda TaxID=1286698 RepID=UPI001CA61526|nr:HAMP domain-containing methyl-accepting chemotaxis protein [Crassaminicella profunda]QZY54834.1 methyl-accepting chemotaxis protein [Crassaminicella profunda]
MEEKKKVKLNKSQEKKKEKRPNKPKKEKKKKTHVGIWNNLRIGYKYGVVLAIVFVFFIMSAGLAINTILNINQNIKKIEATDQRAIMITQMGSIFREKDVKIGEFIFYGQDTYFNEYEETRVEFMTLIDEIEPMMNTNELQFLFDRIVDNEKKVKSMVEQYIVQAVKFKDHAKLMDAKRTTSVIRKSTVALFERIKEEVEKDRKVEIKKAHDSMEAAIKILVITGVCVILFSVIIMIIISRKIRNQLSNVIQITNKAAQGDLTIKALDYKGKDEIGQLAASINQMVNNLRGMMNEVLHVSGEANKQTDAFINIAKEVRRGSEQIAATMQQMAVGAEEQANSSTEIAHAINNLSKLIEETNLKGEELKKSSEEVMTVADLGNQQLLISVDQMDVINHVVKDSVDKVNRLNHKTQNISQLINVINEISEQTNLLALNAAIEAARAGEAGRGFAVVSEEIRKLAEQVGNSVSEIRGIVEDIQNESDNMAKSLEDGYKQVEDGTEQIKKTEESFNKINEEVKDMAQKIQHVSKNLEKVTYHSGEIGSSIEQVAAIAEENSASIEQTSALAQQEDSSMEMMREENEKMIASIENLKILVDQFKL